MSDLAKKDYLESINRAIDHVTRNLADPLRLEDLSRVACFSPYHFHRIFRALVGETLHAFVLRLRLERALYLISHREGASLTEIALSCGFSSSSDFSRRFRARYGVAPRNFDLERFRLANREQMLDALVPAERQRLVQLPAGANPDGFAVQLRDVPARRVAYRRVFRPYEGDRVREAFAQLATWAKTRGLAGGRWIGYQWEDPEIVPLHRCRYDVGLVIPDDVKVRREVSTTAFPPMKVAEIEMAGSIELEMRALYWLYGTWLPQSGYAPGNQPGFEAFLGEPFAHGPDHFELKLQLAVVPAGAPL